MSVHELYTRQPLPDLIKKLQSARAIKAKAVKELSRLNDQESVEGENWTWSEQELMNRVFRNATRIEDSVREVLQARGHNLASFGL